MASSQINGISTANMQARRRQRGQWTMAKHGKDGPTKSSTLLSRAMATQRTSLVAGYAEGVAIKSTTPGVRKGTNLDSHPHSFNLFHFFFLNLVLSLALQRLNPTHLIEDHHQWKRKVREREEKMAQLPWMFIACHVQKLHFCSLYVIN